MSPTVPDIDADTRRRTRQLRLRIARRRRRINQRIGAMTLEGHRLTSWRTYVTHYPLAAVAAAFGVGLAAAAAFRPTSWIRLLGAQLIGTACAALRADLRREVRRFAVSLLRSQQDGPDPAASDSHRP